MSSATATAHTTAMPDSDTDARANAFSLSGAVVLTDEGRQGTLQRTACHLHQPEVAAGGRRTRDEQHAVAIDDRLHDEPADRDDRVAEGEGRAQPEQLMERAGFKPEIPEGGQQVGIGAQLP